VRVHQRLEVGLPLGGERGALRRGAGVRVHRGRTGEFFPGEDKIDDFMAYVDDDCMNSFTDGQFDRMRDHWLAYRAP
jgi:hypothetical protein